MKQKNMKKTKENPKEKNNNISEILQIVAWTMGLIVMSLLIYIMLKMLK